MRLRNQKTGEMGDLIIDKALLVVRTGTAWLHYSSLAELNEEWEDYEEPKTFFTIYYDGTISEFKDGDDDQIRDMKAIGNYFETIEEAEKAVEKLKAWKRLKDKGFRLEGWTIDDGLRISICTNIDSDGIYDEYRKEVKKDLDVCFGGDE